MDTPAEISQLNHTKAVEKILWLDITVDNVLRVNVLERLADLEDVVSCLLLIVAAHWLTL